MRSITRYCERKQSRQRSYITVHHTAPLDCSISVCGVCVCPAEGSVCSTVGTAGAVRDVRDVRGVSGVGGVRGVWCVWSLGGGVV